MNRFMQNFGNPTPMVAEEFPETYRPSPFGTSQAQQSRLERKFDSGFGEPMAHDGFDAMNTGRNGSTRDSIELSFSQLSSMKVLYFLDNDKEPNCPICVQMLSVDHFHYNLCTHSVSKIQMLPKLLPQPLKFCNSCKLTQKDNGVLYKVCGGCEAVYYCSRDCQIANWKRHQGACQEKCQANTKNNPKPFDNNPCAPVPPKAETHSGDPFKQAMSVPFEPKNDRANKFTPPSALMMDAKPFPMPNKPPSKELAGNEFGSLGKDELMPRTPSSFGVRPPPTPNMESKVAKGKTMKMKPLEVGQQYSMLPLYVQSIHSKREVNFFTSHKELVGELCKEMMAKAINAAPVTEQAIINDHVFSVKYENVWYRGMVQLKNETHICVYYVDFGNMNYVPKAEISQTFRQLPKGMELETVPPAAIKMTIRNVPNAQYYSMCVDRLNEFIEKSTLIKTLILSYNENFDYYVVKIIEE